MAIKNSRFNNSRCHGLIYDFIYAVFLRVYAAPGVISVIVAKPVSSLIKRIEFSRASLACILYFRFTFIALFNLY